MFIQFPVMECEEEESIYYGCVEDNGCCFGFWKNHTFYSLSNFMADFTTEVISSHESSSANPPGYVFQITYHDERILG